MKDPRKLAVLHIEDSLDMRGQEPDAELVGLSSEDRALYVEISQGTFREWKFMEWATRDKIRKNPPKRLKALIFASIYQLFFLDRVPNYAVFSEAKRLAGIWGFSDAETSFLHAVLKTCERERGKLLETREEALDSLIAGRLPTTELDWSILNVTPELLGLLSSGFSDATKAAATKRALRAVLAMKQKPKLLGYAVVPGESEKQFESAITKRAVTLSAEQIRKQSEDFRVQGEASLWASDVAASALGVLWKSKKPEDRRSAIRVLEMTSGKGGKCLSTLCALSSDIRQDIHIDWIACDVSNDQLKILQTEVQPIVEKYFPQVKLTICCTDWGENPVGRHYDFVWLDAPCTGFGTLSKLPEIALTRGAKAYTAVQTLSQTQARLARLGAEISSKHGVFMYSVCTLTAAETIGIRSQVAEILTDRVITEKFLWPGAEPAPTAEGFYLSVFAPSDYKIQV